MSTMPNRIFPQITFQEFTGIVGQEIKETFLAVTQTTKQFILTHVDEDREAVQKVVTTGHKAARRLMPPILKMARRLAYAMQEIDYESEKASKAHVMLAESYIWASFCVIAYRLGGIFGMLTITNSILKPVLMQSNAFVLATFVLPVYGHLYSRKTLRSDGGHRTFVLCISFVIGFLLAYVTGQVHSWSPPVFTVPLCIGLVTCLRASKWGSVLGWRISYVLIATLTPFCLNILWDYYVSKSASGLAVAPWVLISGLAFVDVQLQLGRVKRGWSAAQIEHFDSAMVYIIGQFWFCTYPHAVLPFSSSINANQ